jgi:hypothetical protein
MKRLKICITASAALVAAISCPVATATIYGEGEGFYYISFSQNDSYPGGNQFMSVGPFAEVEDCVAAQQDDADNNDSWLPYYGTGIQCDWVFHGEVDSLQDAVDHWNTPIGNGSNPPGKLDAATLQSIAGLRRVYDVEGYEARLDALLAPRR